jgi:hypothetical protein
MIFILRTNSILKFSVVNISQENLLIFNIPQPHLEEIKYGSPTFSGTPLPRLIHDFSSEFSPEEIYYAPRDTEASSFVSMPNRIKP